MKRSISVSQLGVALGIYLAAPAFALSAPAPPGNNKAPSMSHPTPKVLHRVTKAPPKTASAPRLTPVSILVHASADVGGKTFTLGELAEITGGAKSLREALARVEVGTSPLPGLSRTIFAGDITVHMRVNHLDGKDVELIAPPTIRITRTGHDIGGEEITRTAVEAGKAAIKDIPNAILEPEPITEKITVAAGKIQIVPGAYHGQVDQGIIRVPVSLFVDGKLGQTLEVTLHIKRKSAVLVARRTLEPHDIVTAADVMLVPTDLPTGFTRPVVDLEAAIGKRTKRRILMEAPISETMLETPPAVTVGDTLTLEWAYGSIHITAPGLAQQTGAIGDVIRVYASDTHKTLQAIILDSHTARIADSGENADPNP